MNQKRIEWLDIAKGLAIILVVIGHSPATSGVKGIIYSFHIPLFFFLSGFTFDEQKYNNTLSFVRSRVSKIVVPYLLFSIAEYIIYLSWERNVYNTNYEAISIIKGILLASASTMKIHQVLWFLPSLFIVQLLFFFIAKYFSRTYSISLVLVIFSVIGFWFSSYVNVRMPWFIDSSFTAVVFYGIGYLYKKYDYLVDKKIQTYYAEIAIFSFAMLYIFSYLNTHKSAVDMFGLAYNNYYYYYISAIFGIIFTIMFSKMIKVSRLLSYLGKNTMIIFVFHSNMFVVINFILGFIRNKYNLQFSVVYAMKWSLIYTTMSITLLIPIIMIFNSCLNNYKAQVLNKADV